MFERHLVRLRPRSDTNYVSSGRTVLTTNRNGFIEGEGDQGLFVHETRLLSRYRYLIDGVPLHPVALSNFDQRSWLGYYMALNSFSADKPTPVKVNDAAQQAVELKLSRFAGGGLHEDAGLTNFRQEAVSFQLEIELHADFADVAETDGNRKQRGKIETDWNADPSGGWTLAFRYRAEHAYAHQGERGLATTSRALRLRFYHATTPPRREKDRIVFDIVLKPHETWHLCIDFVPEIDGEHLAPLYQCHGFAPEKIEFDRRTRIFFDSSTQFVTPETGTLTAVVAGALERGKRDLASLRLFDLDRGDEAWTFAAGLPIYVALFGRDTLTAAWEAAPVNAALMRGTLSALAAYQGKEWNDWRDEQPGRMMHEIHTGPLSALNYNPHARDYDSVTTSGFYPFVLAQLWHWTGDKALVAPFLDSAIACVQWLNDGEKDGFCAYQTHSVQGMKNQSWKDSGDAIVYEDGSQVPTPISTCEQQGIVYVSKMNLAELLWWFDRKDEAKRLYREAKELKKRFNAAFWMEDEGFFAMALDPDKRQVRSIGSNPLQCVATGIADEKLVPATMARLFAEDMFSGWGVRTLSAKHPAYNPYAYHRGTVWPVEHGPLAVGAYRYGYHDYVERICRAQFELAALFQYDRLPECITGHPRDADHPFPAIYPAANWPQAWSATTPYTLLQTMLGLQPFAPLDFLFVDPFLPEWLPEITVKNMRMGDARITIRFWRNKDGCSNYEILESEGPVHVVRQPSPWSLTAGLTERGKDLVSSFVH